ncbi:hypothetical protein JCM10212_001917 [Sporobolomyces blumeae]
MSSSTTPSTTGRRPPFYPFPDDRDLELVPLKTIELENFARLADFEHLPNPNVAWNEEREKILDWIYAPGSPCLVDPSRPDQHETCLTDAAFARRHRARFAVEDLARRFNAIYENPEYMADQRAWWKTVTKSLAGWLYTIGIAEFKRGTRRVGDLDEFYAGLNFVPELTVANLCARDGDGFIELSGSQAGSPHGVTIYRFGCVKPEVYLIKVEPSFVPHEYPPSSLPSRTSNEADQFCSVCGAAATPPRSLSCCSKCKAAGRFQIQCQKADWKHHRREGRCGVPLPTFSIPLIAPPPRLSTLVEARRAGLLQQPNKRPDSYWARRIVGTDAFIWTGVGHLFHDLERGARVNATLRETAIRALRSKDAEAIALLAFVTLSEAPLPELKGETCVSIVPRPGDSWDEVDLTYQEDFDQRQKQFRELFELEDARAWRDVVARGKVEVEKAENADLKDIYLAWKNENLLRLLVRGAVRH